MQKLQNIQKTTNTRKQYPLTGLCNLEALVNVDDRGQILLPKDLREKAKIGPGDKLAVVTCEEDGEVTVIALIKSNNIAGMINDFIMPKLGPLG
jgi:AbrB family looped-hinge helix DNA binding protein